MATLPCSLLSRFFLCLLLTIKSFCFLFAAQALHPNYTTMPDYRNNNTSISNGSCPNYSDCTSKYSGSLPNSSNLTFNDGVSLDNSSNPTLKNSGSLHNSSSLTSKNSGPLHNSSNLTLKDSGSFPITPPDLISIANGSSSYPSNVTSNNIWGWNGLLHCYGKECSSPLSSSSSSSSQPEVAVGIPCKYAKELLFIAEHHDKTSHAIWVPSSIHSQSSSYNNHAQHWKIRFDSLHKAYTIPPMVKLKASILQDDPTNSSTTSEVQFALVGPWRAPHKGGCYYAISLEDPSFDELWGSFMQALVKGGGGGVAILEQNKVGISKGELMQEEEEEGDDDGLGYTSKKKDRKRKARRRHRKSPAPPTLQKCMNRLPWTGLLATALCYASRGGPLHSLGPCTSFSPIDVSTLVTCVGALGNLNLGNLNPDPNPNP